MNASVRLVLRILSALFVVAGGVLHYQIWDDRYRSIPSGAVPGLWVVKDGFPVNAALSVVLAVGVLFLARRPIVLAATFVFELACIAALVLSRQASIFGWKEPLWDSDAKKVLVVEIVAAVLLAVLVAVDFVRSESGAPARAVPA